MLRDYQIQAAESIIEEFNTSRSTLLVCATGGGKTVIFSEVAKRLNVPTMLIAPMEELLDQAYKAMIHFGGFKQYEIGFEVGERRIGRHIPKIVLASKDSLHAKRLAKYTDQFGLIIHDEADYATSGTWSIIDRFPSAKILGVTATPKRTDGLKLVKFYQSVAEVIEIIDLISWGYLVPIIQQYVPAESIDLSNVTVTRKGDFNEDELDAQMQEERAVMSLSKIALEESEGRPTLVFCTSIDHAKSVAEMINRYKPGSATSISGEDSDRETKLSEFRRGRYQYMCNCMILTRGIDLPFVCHVIMGRPTKSLTLYTQMLGRGTRLLGSTLAESISAGKANLKVTDLVGVSGQHKLVTATDVLIPGDDDVRDVVERRIREKGSAPILGVMKEAEQEVAEKRRAMIIAEQAKYKTVDVDPFGVLGIYSRRHGYGVRPTEKQMQELRKFGFRDNEISLVDKQQADILITNRRTAMQTGMASWRQRKQLMRFGLYPNITFDHAKKVMAIIAANNWKLQGVEQRIDAVIKESLSEFELPF